MRLADEVLTGFGVPHECAVVSAHRTPQWMAEYASQAADRGLEVIIAGAGGAAHLPGMTASMTDLPVLGVPIETKALKGMDSLLSIVQMPGGIPVATVAVGNAKNAGLLAVRILGASDPPSMIARYSAPERRCPCQHFLRRNGLWPMPGRRCCPVAMEVCPRVFSGRPSLA
jgi:5-(carboxyamino)imidazole ribonucleotide mutase